MNIPSVISKPLTTVVNKAGKVYDKAAKSSWMQKQFSEFETDKGRFAAKMIVWSIVSKDLVNCVLYTYQSANNEKIPEDKRKFVAAVDAMNGLVMVFGQLFAGKVLDQKVAPFIKSLFTGTEVDSKGKELNANIKNATGRIFHDDNVRQRVADKVIEKGMKLKDVDLGATTKEVLKRTKEPFIAGLGIVITTIGTTAIVKRLLAPLISTPIAGAVNDKLLKSKGNAEKDNRMTYEYSALASASRFHNQEDSKLVKS